MSMNLIKANHSQLAKITIESLLPLEIPASISILFPKFLNHFIILVFAMLIFLAL